MFCRAKSPTDEPVASGVHCVRRAALVLLGRRFRYGAERVDTHQAHYRHAVQSSVAGHKRVPGIPDGAAEPGAEKRAREADRRVHRHIRVRHGHQPPGGHGEIPELPEVRTERGHRRRAVRHRHAGAVGFNQHHSAVRDRRQPAVRENVRSVSHRREQNLRHPRRSGEKEGDY